LSEGQRFLPQEAIEGAVAEANGRMDKAKLDRWTPPTQPDRVEPSSTQVDRPRSSLIRSAQDNRTKSIEFGKITAEIPRSITANTGSVDRRSEAVRDFEESEKRYLASQVAGVESGIDRNTISDPAAQNNLSENQSESMESRGKQAQLSYWERNLAPMNSERFTTRMTERRGEKERGEAKAMERVAVTLPNGLKFEGSQDQVDSFLVKHGFGPAPEKSAIAANPVANELAKTISANLKTEATPATGIAEGLKKTWLQTENSETRAEKPVELDFKRLMTEIAGLKLKTLPEVRKERALTAMDKIKIFFTIKEEPELVKNDLLSKLADIDVAVARAEAEVYNRRVTELQGIFELAKNVLEKQVGYEKNRAAFLRAQERVAAHITRLGGLSPVIMGEEQRSLLISELQESLGTAAVDFAAQQLELRNALEAAQSEALAKSGGYPELQVMVTAFGQKIKDLALNWTTDYNEPPLVYQSAKIEEGGATSSVPSSNVIPISRAAGVAPQPLANVA